MNGHRVSMTLAAGDYERLVAAAVAERKSPTAFAADVLKAYLMRSFFVGSQEPIQAAKPLLDRSGVESGEDLFTQTLPGVPDLPIGPSRAERRAAKRVKSKLK